MKTTNFSWLAMILLVAGCKTQPRYPVPADSFNTAEIPGMTNVRVFADQTDPLVMKRFNALLSGIDMSGGSDQIFNLLGLSGGGENGAYGAGVLAGWSDSGKRPEFDVVTGISTGSLIAPVAFLGSSHDESLHTYYQITEEDVLIKLGIFGILKQKTALTKSHPLIDLIATVVQQKEIERIAEEHRKGRRLLMATTNLDSQQGIIWDIGKIAASGHPSALSLVRSVMLASSSIPVAFPPVLIGVEVDGIPHDEMHVDGGVITQAFGAGVFLAESVELKKNQERHFYLIRNGYFEPNYKAPKMKITSIAGRSLGTVIKAMGVADLLRAYTMSVATGTDFHYTSISPTFDVQPTKAFDPVYMKALFDLGYEFGKSGQEWPSVPPIVQNISIDEE